MAQDRTFNPAVVIPAAIITLVLFMSYEYRPGSLSYTISPPITQPVIQRTYVKRIETPMTVHNDSLDCHVLRNSNSCTTLPNFFMYPAFQRYHKDAIISFMHIPKCGGTTMKECMTFVASKKGRAKPFLLHTESRRKLTEDFLNGDYGILQKSSLFMGDYTFGFCDQIHDKLGDQKCSTFVILREPYDRLVSHYYYCRQLDAHVIGIPDCANSSITEWSLATRSILWNEIFTDIKCTETDDSRWKCAVDYGSLLKEAYVLGRNESYVDSVVAGLDKHFSLIGLTEDMATTMRMLQSVYDLPFFDYCKRIDYNVGKYSDRSHESNTTETREEARRTLVESDEVREMIYAELRIYKRAQEIFEIEKRDLEETQNRVNIKIF